MTMRRVLFVIASLALASTSANAQSSAAACGPLPDSTARQVVKMFGDLRVCMLALKVGALENDLPQEWAARASLLVLETQRPDDNRRAAISGSSVSWTINGREAPQDSLAQAWQKAVVDLADATHQADQLRARSAALREQIDSLPARIAATKNQITYVKRRDADLNRTIMNAGNTERSIRSQLAQAQRALSSARARASSASARASSARDERERAAAAAEAQSAEQQVSNISMAISGLEYELARGDASRTIAAAEEELRALRPEHTLALLSLELSGYEAMNLADLQREMQELDAPVRQRLLDTEVDARLARLRAILR
jgi:predicted  nucleic acid-binding Zn-ribbon protein